MSWGAQNRSKDAKTPSVAGGRSRKPKPALCGIQPYAAVIAAVVGQLSVARNMLKKVLALGLFAMPVPTSAS
jgi:hypothetical protein